MIQQARIAQIAAAFRQVNVGQNGRLSAQRLLEMITIDAAKAIGMEKEIGSLELGKKADIIVVDTSQPHLIPSLDPVANLMHFGEGSDVETVIIDGRVVIEQRRTRTINEQEMLRQAQERGERMWINFHNK
jgi:cytosine/adenosine deaminase-related metal-dependent hydrolase